MYLILKKKVLKILRMIGAPGFFHIASLTDKHWEWLHTDLWGVAALGQVAGNRYSRPTLGEGKGPSDGECHIRFTSGFYTENTELCQECAKSSMSGSRSLCDLSPEA